MSLTRADDAFSDKEELRARIWAVHKKKPLPAMTNGRLVPRFGPIVVDASGSLTSRCWKPDPDEFEFVASGELGTGRQCNL